MTPVLQNKNSIQGLKIAAVACLYFISGKFALLLAVPPGYASPVWLAAGIGLAGLLLYGNGIWPGVLIGSVAVNATVVFDPSAAGVAFTAFLLPLGIASGATLQALLGALLIRRFVGFPMPLDRLNGIFKILALGGPVSCVCSATVGSACLLAMSEIHWDGMGPTWWTWWLGDTIGVLVIIPVVSAWYVELHRARLRTRLSVVLPLCLACGVTLVMFLDVHRGERARARITFERRCEHLSQALSTNLKAYIDVLYSIRGFFMASRHVERAEFHAFVTYPLARNPGIKALEWIPRVPDAQRDFFKESARKSGHTDFQFRQIDARGRLQPAQQRGEYYPVYYVEPYAGNETALGFDLASNPARRAAIDLARDRGEATATARVTLVQETSTQYGVLIFLPIYSKLAPGADIHERRDHLKGFALGVFRVGDMVDAVAGNPNYDGISLALYDRGGLTPELLYASPGMVNKPPDMLPGSPPSICDEASVLFCWEASFTIASRQWKLYFRPTPAYFKSLHFWESRAVMVGGLLFSSLLGSFLLLVAGRTAMVERAVHHRTAELSRTNLELERENHERQRVEDALLKSRSELEQRVDERTGELRMMVTRLRQEIGERKKSEKMLYASETKFRGFVESAPDAILTVDKNNRVIFANKQAERLFGYASGELPGQSHDALIPPGLRSPHKNHQTEYFNDPYPRPMGSDLDLAGRRKDGTEFPVEIALSPLQTDNGVQVISIIRDVSERKEKETELRKYREDLEELVDARTAELQITMEKAQESDRIKSAFLASMSHELRTPLNSIIGFSGILLQGLGGPLNEEQEKQLGMVRNSARHLLSLINDVLDISKIEAGQLEVSIKPFKMRDAIEKAVQTITPLADEAGLSLRVHVAAAVDQIVSDRRRVEQILINLLNNAVKFTSHGWVHLACRIEANQMLTTVTDTGIGFSAENMDKLFQTFSQIDTGTDRRYEGTGLGLSICQKLLALLGGRIWAESGREGKGTRFTFTLPMAESKENV